MDYVAPFFQEAAYRLGVEKLLGIEEDIPERASLIRILMMELCRIASHLVAIGSTGNEMGATTIMTIGFAPARNPAHLRRITGLRMNHEHIRPGGVVQDIGEGTTDYIRDRPRRARKDIGELQDILVENPIKKRPCDVAVMPLSGLMASARPALPRRRLALTCARASPTAATELRNSTFPPATSRTSTTARWSARRVLRRSMRIIWQVLAKLDQCEGAPTMVADPESPARAPGGRHRRPGQLGRARPRDHGESMESSSTTSSSSRGFKLVPAGQVFAGPGPSSANRRASWAFTSSPTAARARSARTSATPPTPTCKRAGHDDRRRGPAGRRSSHWPLSTPFSRR